MDGDLVEVMGDLSPEEAGEVELLLAAMGIRAIARTSSSGAAPGRSSGVFTAPEDVEHARRILVEEFPEGRPLAAPAPRPPAPPVPRSRHGRLAVAGLLLVLGAAFAALHLRGDPATRADFLRHGAIAATQIAQGELWRFATAVFVHFDALHLLANTAVFLLVAPPLADLLGPLRLVVVFLATGIAGNVASHVLSPSLALKGGASGAIAGLLGALAGQQLRPDRRSRFRRWQVLGALAAVYALLVGSGQGHDDVAHLGGLLSGIALGRALRPRRAVTAEAVAGAAPREP
jgi:membrane associated rhomboid family serine protease